MRQIEAGRATRHPWLTWLLVLSSLLLLGFTAQAPEQPAQVIHVPGDYATIAQALAAAHAGDTVQVAVGTYTETGLSIPSGVSLVGAGWSRSIISGNGSGVVVYPGSDTLVEGFTIRGSGSGYFDAGIWVSQGSVTLRQNRITANANAVWAWCFDPPTCNIHVTLERNILDGNSSNGANSSEYAIFTVRNNTFTGNGGSGLILNNAASLAENNIVVSNTGAGIVSNSGPQVHYNDVWNNGQDYSGSLIAGEGSLALDPLLRNAATADVRLYAASPVIGYGTPGGTDMGAVPFSPVGTSPGSVTLVQTGANLWRVDWSATSAEGYRVYYGPCTRQTTTVAYVGAVNSYQISHVSAEGVGYVAVSASDAQGRESAVRLATGIQAPCPTAPQNLEVGAFPGGRIRLQWQGTSGLAQGYQIERAHAAISPTAYSLIATVPAGTSVYTDTPPRLEETYWYRMRAYNANGGSPFSRQSYNATFDQVPNLDEQYLMVLINEARAAPGAFGYPAISPVPPLMHNPLLNYAAHSYSQAILNSGFQIGHCDLIGRCPTERAHAVGYIGGVAENLIQGMDGPDWVKSSNQAIMDSEPHRNNILCSCFTEAGLGHTYDPNKGGDSDWKGQYTETFSSRQGITVTHLPSGVVIPYGGSPDTQFTYIVNYFHAAGLGPTQALVYIDDVPYAMSLSTGALANGTFRYTTTLSAGSHQYYFYFAFSGGTARQPESGAYSYPIVFGHPVYLPMVVSEQ